MQRMPQRDIHLWTVGLAFLERGCRDGVGDRCGMKGGSLVCRCGLGDVLLRHLQSRFHLCLMHGPFPFFPFFGFSTVLLWARGAWAFRLAWAEEWAVGCK